MNPKKTICLCYDHDALDAATFYAATFPDSAVGRVMRAPGDSPSGRQGDILTVEFTVLGIPCLGLNGGPAFRHSEAFSFQVATDDQAETDRYWNAIVGNGGEESACGWCRDKWGLSWQITPRALTDAIVDPDPAAGPVVTSFVFRVRSVPAALYKALGGFATNGINITKLESYILDGAFTVAQFYADIEGHPDQRPVRLALEELGFFSREVKILGVYPASSFRKLPNGR